MGYLGLSEPAEKQDNLFQRIFWPGNGAADVDALGQRGFWICASFGTVLCVLLVAKEHWVLGLLTLVFYWLGGVGVREHSTFAAVSVAVAYVLNLSSSLFVGSFPSVIAIFAAILLISNIRATHIAARLAKRGEPDLLPERMRETWRDRLVNDMPSRIWPRARIVFFWYCRPLSVAYALRNRRSRHARYA